MTSGATCTKIKGMETPSNESAVDIIVEIPGSFMATYRDGKITKFTFVPAGGHAGYFGPAAVVTDVFDADSGEFPADDDGWELDTESVDGPFWRAVQERLGTDAEHTFEWEE